MSIPPLSELLRNPWPPEEPTPAARFAPFLLPNEDILWAGQPNAECHTRQFLRGANILFGVLAAVFAILPIVDYCLNIVGGIDKLWIGFSIFSLLCLVFARTIKEAVPNQCFAVTNLRILSYDPHNDGPEFSALSLREVSRVSVKIDKNDCGTICFNPWLLKAHSQRPFYCIENAEAAAALIMDAKQKVCERKVL